jgi:hypothetical protein
MRSYGPVVFTIYHNYGNVKVNFTKTKNEYSKK